jgi:hypothetical protein
MGTEAVWVPLALAAVSGGAQYANQKAASNREQSAEAQSIMDQQAIQQKAAGAANALTKQIASDSPTPIQGQATGAYVQALRRNAAGSTQGGDTSGGDTTFGASTSALAPAAGASSRYNAGTAASQNQVAQYGNTYAADQGTIDAATRMRQNEGLGMQTLGTNLQGLGASSYTKNFVDQLRAQVAGQANPWVSLGASLLGNYANNSSKKIPDATNYDYLSAQQTQGTPGAYGG